MARVLVTGGSGFIGSNLIDALKARGDEVCNLDVLEPRNREHRREWRRISMLDERAVARCVDDFAPQYVYHGAARTDLAGRDVEDYQVNYKGLQVLFNSLHMRRELRRVVVMSSMLVCRLGYRPAHDEDYCPGTSYGASKVQAESIVRRTRLAAVPWVIARPTSIWGPWFGEPYLAFFMAVSRGRYVHPKRCSVHRSYGYVLNSVHQLISLAEADHDSVCGRTFYICDYEPLELGAWADRIAATMDVRKPKRVSISLLRLMARGGDALSRLGVSKVPLTSFRLNNMLTDAVFDTADLRAFTGSLPYSIEEAVQATVGWMRAQGLVRDLRAVRAK